MTLGAAAVSREIGRRPRPAAAPTDVATRLALTTGDSCQCRTNGGDELSELKRAEDAIVAIIAEYRRATEIHGPMASAWEGESVLRGELKELSEEVWWHHPDRKARIRTEAIQVGAMALRFLVDVCGEGGADHDRHRP